MTSNDFVLILFHIFIQGRKSLGQKIPSAKKAQIGQSLRLENHITLCYWLIKVMLLLKCQNLKFLSKCMIWFYYFNFAILFFISFIILLGMLVRWVEKWDPDRDFQIRKSAIAYTFENIFMFHSKFTDMIKKIDRLN